MSKLRGPCGPRGEGLPYGLGTREVSRGLGVLRLIWGGTLVSLLFGYVCSHINRFPGRLLAIAVLLWVVGRKGLCVEDPVGMHEQGSGPGQLPQLQNKPVPHL